MRSSVTTRVFIGDSDRCQYVTDRRPEATGNRQQPEAEQRQNQRQLPTARRDLRHAHNTAQSTASTGFRLRTPASLTPAERLNLPLMTLIPLIKRWIKPSF